MVLMDQFKIKIERVIEKLCDEKLDMYVDEVVTSALSYCIYISSRDYLECCDRDKVEYYSESGVIDIIKILSVELIIILDNIDLVENDDKAWTKVNKSCAIIVKAVIDLKAQMKINIRS